MFEFSEPDSVWIIYCKHEGKFWPVWWARQTYFSDQDARNAIAGLKCNHYSDEFKIVEYTLTRKG